MLQPCTIHKVALMDSLIESIEDIDRLDLNQYNIYPTYIKGQEDSVRNLLKNIYMNFSNQTDVKVSELASPTGSGKTIINRAVGMAVLQLFPSKVNRVIYTTPLRNLVAQIANEEALKIPTVMGRANYPCCTLGMGMNADSCPYRTAYLIRLRPAGCRNCEYQYRKHLFKTQPLVGSTLDFFLYNKRKKISEDMPGDMVIIDESASLEDKLLNQFGIKLPEQVDIDNLIPSLHNWMIELQEEQLTYEEHLDSIGHLINGSNSKILREITDLTKSLNRVERKQRTCSNVISMAGNPDDYLIDNDRKFKLIRGRWPFNSLLKNIEYVIMSSGTPTTALLTNKFDRVEAPHPIPKDRRLVYYSPVGKMSRTNQDKTIPLVAKKIIDIHSEYPKKTIVHAHSYELARKIRDGIVKINPSFSKIVLLQEKKDAVTNGDFYGNRDVSLQKFLTYKGQMIWISVGFDEGLNLLGEEYQRNIIAKVPYPSLGDPWVVKRNTVDENDYGLNKWYRMMTAVLIQQAAGRCTRKRTDYSKTSILDSNFGFFYSQNKIFFEKWFRDALVWNSKKKS